MQIHDGPKARASLNVSVVFNESTVTEAYATSPMKLLTPRSRGRSVCAYVSNFGGGFVAGDQTRLDLRLGKGARCFVTSQSSTKVYRNPSLLPCEHETRADLDSDSLLVLAPAPVQPFAGSSYAQRQQFHLAPGAALVLLDWFTSGRPARGERWAFARFATRNEVWHCAADNAPMKSPSASSLLDAPRQTLKKPGGSGLVQQVQPEPTCAAEMLGTVRSRADGCIFLDSLQLNPRESDLASPYCTGRFNCFAMLLLIGAVVKTPALRILQETGALPVERRAPVLISASPVKDGAVLRVAGEEVAEVEKHLRRCLEPLSDLLGDEPWSRRY
jgi:urease accessory protein